MVSSPLGLIRQHQSRIAGKKKKIKIINPSESLVSSDVRNSNDLTFCNVKLHSDPYFVMENL